MSADELIRAWKDPDYRDGDAGGDDHTAWHDGGHPAGEIVLEPIGGNAVPVFLDTQWQCTHSEYPCTVHPICP
jgi:hypothetical protein